MALKPIYKAIKNPRGNASKTFNWNKVIGHNFTDDGEVVYPPKGFFTFKTKHAEYSEDDDLIMAFPEVDCWLQGAGQNVIMDVILPNVSDAKWHQAVLCNALVPFRNFHASIAHIAPILSENGAFVPFTDHFAAQYKNYRVTSFELMLEFNLTGVNTGSDSFGTCVFRCGVLLIDEETAVSTGARVDNFYDQTRLAKLIRHRYQANTLKTVPVSYAQGITRAGKLMIKANVIDQFLDKKYTSIDVVAAPNSDNVSTPPLDVTDMNNYQGDLLVSQAGMSQYIALPKIKLWAVPFAILVKPFIISTAGDGNAPVQIHLSMQMTQHTQLTNPIKYVSETAD